METLFPIPTDGKDGYGLKLEKAGPTFSLSFNAMRAKITKKYYSYCTLMKFLPDVFFVRLKKTTMSS